MKYCMINSPKERRILHESKYRTFPEYSEPYAIIYADKITDSIQRTLDIFGSNESPITAFKNENDIVILQPKEIYMVRVENKDTIIYGKEPRYRSRKDCTKCNSSLVRIYTNFKINFGQSVLYEQCRGWF